METHFPSLAAALKAESEHRPHYARPRGSTQPDAGKGADQANHFVGVGSSAPVVEPSNLTAGAGTPNARPYSEIGTADANQPLDPTGKAGVPNLPTVYGPPITSRLDGAGGPHNEWDAKIAAANRRGNHLLAQRLQAARARINLAFGILEAVWVATDHQRVMLGLRACPTGLRIMDAKVAA